jgi:hypothetical protein
VKGGSTKYDEFVQRFGEVSPDLARAGLVDADDLMSHLLLDASGVRLFAGGGTVLSDDFCPIEFTAARAMFRLDRELVLGALEPFRAHIPKAIEGMSEGALERRRMWGRLALATRIASEGHFEEAQAKLRDIPVEYRTRATWESGVDAICERALRRAMRAVERRDFDAASTLFAGVPPISSFYNMARVRMAWMLAERGDWDAARKEVEEVLERDPNHAEGKSLLERLLK